MRERSRMVVVVIVIGSALLLGFARSSVAARAHADAAPAIVGFAFPQITGDVGSVGNLLSVSTGTWSGAPTSFAYQWQDCTDSLGTTCTPIGGATSNTYTLQSSDLGSFVDVIVSATNVDGTGNADSFIVGPVGAPEVSGIAFPSISGDTSAAGNVLTVDPGTWTGSPTFTYQWQQCDSSGSNCADIGGATSTMYTILAGDLGHVLQAEVTATNAFGAVTDDAATSALGAPTIQSFQFPQISGDTSAAGNVLTASAGTWSGSPTITYQWELCDSTGAGCTNIPGATTNMYTIQPGDLGHVVDVDVTATNAFGTGDQTASTLSPLGVPGVLGFDFPQITGDPSQTGNVISVTTGTWSGSPTFTYQWQQCDANGVVCNDIPGATSSSYTILLGDVGHVIGVNVTATNAYGSTSETAQTSTPVGLPEVVQFEGPAITGDTSAAGNTLTVSQGTWTGSPTSFTEQWLRCDSSGNNCTNITGATSTTYQLQVIDLGHVIDANITATNAGGSTTATAVTFAAVGAPTIANFAFPSISGDDSVVGHVLTVSNGTWTGSPTFTYQWSQCDSLGFTCNAIGGATSHTYTIQAGDVGHILEASVTATNANGATTESAETAAPVGIPAIQNFDFPSISGDLTGTGHVITVSSGTWSGSPTLTYQWSRCTAPEVGCVTIGGATSSTYTTQNADLGQFLEADVTATNGNGSNDSPAFSQFAVGTPEVLVSPSIGGDTSLVGNVLTTATGTWTGSPTFTFQWKRCTDVFTCVSIGGATSFQYTIQNADLGDFLEVAVTGTNANGSTTRTAETQFVAGAPELVGAFPAITGNPSAVGNTVGVTSGTWVGGTITITYQWSRCNTDFTGCAPIAGQTASTYRIVSADLGKLLDVTVTATNAHGSSAEDASAVVGAPFNTALPAISGDISAVGNSLTVSNGTWAGSPTSFAYSWWRCDASGNNCAQIGGATASHYVLVSADAGHTLFAAVDATNAIGSTFADTLNTAVVGTGAAQHLLTVVLAGSGAGTVTSATPGIDCGDTCSADFSGGSNVVLTPTAAAGSTFNGWSGGGCSGTGGCSVNLSADTTVTATFAASPAAPTITAITPSGAPHSTVTVTGTNFGFTRSVKLHGESVPFSLVSATTITFTVPADATSGTISVTTTSGTATSSGSFTVSSPPTITSIGPGSGPIGTVVTITGTSLGTVVGVEIGHILVVPTSVSATQVTFVIPAGATSGTIEVLSRAGAATSAGTFTVTG